MTKHAKLQPVRGTHDWLPEQAQQFQWVVETTRRAAACYGFGEIITPVFEFSDVFHRTLGDTSDVVSKETYTFNDRGGESLTLRPEFTASVVRAFISNGLNDQLPCKFFYAGPAFRYERPQKGRMRQFHQIGVELLGADEVQADLEIIALGHQMLSALGVADKVTLELNSLGDAAGRARYREALVAYFAKHQGGLSEDSKARLEKNPLRILDSKDAGDKLLIADAPRMHDYFSDESNSMFEALQSGLQSFGIPFTFNERLVRGLDYYNHTVFEFTTSALGSQNAVLSGGRYDGLVALMGGQDVSGIGFAAGVERLHELCVMSATAPAVTYAPVVMVPLGERAQIESLVLVQRLRMQGFIIEQGYKGNMAKRLKKADKHGATLALLLGDDECANGTITLKDLTSGQQRTIPQAQLAQALLETELAAYKA